MHVDRFNFPGGEVQVTVSPDTPLDNRLTSYIRNSDDLVAMLLVTDAMRRMGQQEIHLTLPYVPFGRQDRVMVRGQSFSLKVFCDILNAQNYASVTIWDPHSDVTPALINNCRVVEQHIIVSNNRGVLRSPGSKGEDILVCPDAGARKKILKVAQAAGYKDIIYADKVRDVATGKITGTTLNLHGDEYFDRDFLIVDDICDGGYTFIELAKELKRFTSGKIKLYVTHGIFSKGLFVFDGLIDEIYTANCWLTPEEVNIQRSLLDNRVDLRLITP